MIKPTFHVVAGIIENERGEVLLSSRPADKTYAGYWEFAGGKVEQGETDLMALKREMREELGLEIHHARIWLTKTDENADRIVHLRFYRVGANDWSGEPKNLENQSFAWQKAGHYTVEPMLPANASLLKALAIPRVLMGDLKTVLRDKQDDFRVVPYELAENHHQNMWISLENLRKIGIFPKKEQVWILVQNADEFAQAQDADAIVWQICSEKQADELYQQLQQGVAMPILAYCVPSLAEKWAEKWQDFGLHALLVDEQTALA